jgi:hypothetical protein
MTNVIVKIILAILGLIVISQFLQPLLLKLYFPFGLVVLVLLYILVVAYLFGWVNF